MNLPGNPNRTQINQVLASQGLELLPEYGFNNTYAVVVRDEQAQELGLRRIGLNSAFAQQLA